MEVIGAIFARGGSKGIPKKNLQKIASKSLLDISINHLKETNTCKSIFVCSDDKLILDQGKNNNVNIFLRNPNNCNDDSSEIDAWKELANYLLNENLCSINDLLLIAPTTSPFRKPETLIELVRILKIDKQCDAAIVINNSRRHPDFNLLKFEKNKNFLKTYSGSQRKSYRQECEKAFDMSTVGYCIRLKSCLDINSLFDINVRGIERGEKECWDIDSPFDLEVAKLFSL